MKTKGITCIVLYAYWFSTILQYDSIKISAHMGQMSDFLNHKKIKYMPRKSTGQPGLVNYDFH